MFAHVPSAYPWQSYRDTNRGSRECAYQGEVMLAAIGAILLVLWLLGFVAFHITFGAIHLLLVIAVVLFVVHLLTSRRAAV